MEAAFQEVSKQLQESIQSNLSSEAIGKAFVASIAAHGCGGRYDEHSFALASRVLSHAVFSFYRERAQAGSQENWFTSRPACNSTEETELGAIFKVRPADISAHLPPLHRASCILLPLRKSVHGHVSCALADSQAVFELARRRTTVVLLQAATELSNEAGTLARTSQSGSADQDTTTLTRLRTLPCTLLVEAIRLTPIHQVQFIVPLLQRAAFSAEVTEAQHTFTFGCRLLSDKVAQVEDAALLGSLTRWMCTVLPLEYRPAFNISKVINSTHPPHIEDVADGAVDSLGMAIDGEKYRLFWGLQSSLQAVDVLTAPDKWAACAAQIEEVLRTFEKPSQVCPLSASSSRVLSVHWPSVVPNIASCAQVDSSSSLANVGQGTVAFLTTASLLTLQTPDATFRRHILSEIMMLIFRGTLYNTEARDVPEKMVRSCSELLPRVRKALIATGTSGAAFTGPLPPFFATFTAMHTRDVRPAGYGILVFFV